METFHKLLLIFFVYVTISNSVHAISAPRDFQSSQPPPHNVKTPPSQSKPHSKSYQILSIPKRTDPALKKICNSTDHYDLCISSISPYINANTTIEPLSVLEMAIKASENQTKSVISKIKKLVNSSSTSPQTVAILKDCKDSYNDALENFQSAFDAIPARDIGTVNSMLSAAITDYGDCEDGFSGQTNPLAAYGEKLMNMVDNCLAIVNLIN